MAKKKTKKTEEPEKESKAPLIGLLNFGSVYASVVFFEDVNKAEITLNKDGHSKKVLIDLEGE